MKKQNLTITIIICGMIFSTNVKAAIQFEFMKKPIAINPTYVKDFLERIDFQRLSSSTKDIIEDAADKIPKSKDDLTIISNQATTNLNETDTWFNSMGIQASNIFKTITNGTLQAGQWMLNGLKAVLNRN